MLRAIIVDDEKLAIDHLERLLVNTGKVEVTHTYLDPTDAVKDIPALEPHIVFLDIDMPEMTGIDLAERIIESSPEIRIVLVTAHDRYGPKAFELGVTDYILKPYHRERIEKVVNKLHHVIKPAQRQGFMIHAFKYFHIKKDGEEIKNIKWRTAKGRELFAYLVQHSDEIVRKDVLIDLFWADVNVKNAFDNLYTTVYQLRKTLDGLDIGVRIENSIHGYKIDFNHVKYDVTEWEHTVDDVIHYMEDQFPDIRKIMRAYNKALNLYKGHYLDEESNVWKENIKEQYMIKFLFLSKQVIRLLREHGQRKEAILICLHLEKLYPHIHYPYFTLMQLYSEMGDRVMVEKHYMALKEMLETEFGIAPEQEIRDWYERWISVQYSR